MFYGRLRFPFRRHCSDPDYHGPQHAALQRESEYWSLFPLAVNNVRSSVFDRPIFVRFQIVMTPTKVPFRGLELVKKPVGITIIRAGDSMVQAFR